MNIKGKKFIAILCFLLGGFLIGDTAYYFYLKSAKPTDLNKLKEQIKAHRNWKDYPDGDEEFEPAHHERKIKRRAYINKRIIAARMKKILYVEGFVLIIVGLVGGGIIVWGKRREKPEIRSINQSERR